MTSLVPVDLNCLLADLERTLAKAYRLRGDVTQAENMEQRAATRADAIRRVLWDPQLQAFGDYDFVHHTLTHRLTAATVYPLYTGVASRQQAKTVAATLQRELLRPGGLATTQVNSGQQWDAPNGWAPLQYLAVIGLRRYSEAALAQTIATRWIRTNVSYYQHTGKLVEKYDVDAHRPASRRAVANIRCRMASAGPMACCARCSCCIRRRCRPRRRQRYSRRSSGRVGGGRCRCGAENRIGCNKVRDRSHRFAANGRFTRGRLASGGFGVAHRNRSLCLLVVLMPAPSPPAPHATTRDAARPP